MSLILKGIDLDTDYGLCILTKSGELITANGKHIQAIQIPKNHGRLIDENMTYIDKTIDGYFEIYAPTILEAEE